MSELTVAAIKKLKVAELKAELTKRGLAVKGKKDELAKRLIEAIEEDNQDEVEEVPAANEDVGESQGTLDDSQQSQESENTTISESAVEGNSQEVSDESVSKEVSTEKTEDDWVMVEAPKPEETAAVEDSAESQQTATETPEQEPMEEDAPVSTEKPADASETKVEEKIEDTSKAESSKDESMEQQAVETDKKEDKKEGKTSKESEKKKESPKKEKKVEEPPPEDKYVEVEFEEGEDVDRVPIEEGHVALDSYSCDLNFVVGEKGLSGRTLIKNGMAYMWGGARANKGTKGGKVGYEVKILESRTVDLPESEAPTHAIRIGWSTDKSSMQLGESSHSYGYESTGKLCASSSFVEYGEKFETGDVIGTFLDLESEPKTLKYTKNGKDLGVAMSMTVNLEEKPLFPHILVRNMAFEVNFGGNEEPWFELLEGYTLLQNAGEEKITDNSITPPEGKENCEVIMLVGLPNAGKTSWATKYVDSHLKKKYNVVGMGEILERCKLEGKRRKKTDSNYTTLMKTAIQILGKFYEICPKKTRNYIYDQTNVYKTAQETKMKAFEKFKKRAVVVVPTHDNLRRRTSDAKRKVDTVIDIPFADLCDMKCEFHVPEVGTIFEEVIYPELDERNAKKTVRDYQSDGARAKRTGRDEFYPKKKYDDRRDRYSGGRRDEGWRNSGSGYGGGYSSGGYGGYNKGYGSGGYNRGRDQYQDPYRRNSGGSGGGYRQNSSYGGSGSYNKGGSYNSGSNYNSGYGNYGSNYGSNYNYSSYGGSYGSYGQNYNNQQGSNNRNNTSGNWGQYNQGQYNTGAQQGSWGSNSSGNWSNYYGNYYGNNSYGNSGSGGYSY